MSDLPPESLNKWQRRYRRLRGQGLCPHCGRGCAPYFECDVRRLEKNVRRLIDRMHKQGAAEPIGRGWVLTGKPYRGKTIKPNDARHLPRFAKRPIDEDSQADIFKTILINAGHGLTAEEIAEHYVALRRAS